MEPLHHAFSYILPLRAHRSLANGELSVYIEWLAQRCELLIVDGSPPEIFATHHVAWTPHAQHIAPAPDLVTPMGKVGGVLTGVRHATHERIIIADDDVRYDADALGRVVALLADAEVVRPQNYFSPMPWHALWDTGRSLLNRLHGGDWPGTLAVRKSILLRTGGYDGCAMFENLELVRTVIAAGGRECVPLDLFVARRPSTTTHFWSQRVRQAYDELARPARLAMQLAALPLAIATAARFGFIALAIGAAIIVLAAEAGRRRARGTTVFPPPAALMAVAWVAERAICSWLALISRVAFGGIRYRGRVLRHAATPMRELKARLSAETGLRQSA